MSGTATIVSDAESFTGASLVGQTVDQARNSFASAFQIPANAYPSLNGRRVTDGTTIIKENDELVLSRPTGEKG